MTSNFFKSIKTKDKIPTYKYLVAGNWQEALSRKLISVYSPIDGSLVGRVQSCNQKEADLIVVNASFAQPSWAFKSINERARVLKKAALLLEKEAEYLASLLVLEIGKLKKEALSEVLRSVEYINKTISHPVFQKEESQKIGKKTCKIVRVPLGVVLVISPFNYPINLSVSKIAPALFSGNSVVLKGPTQGAISVLHLAEILRRAGLPPGVLNVVTGRGSEIGDFLVEHGLLNMIGFTGSTSVGKRLAVKAGMTRLLLELGGKDAGIVLKDADLDLAASEIVKGAFSYAGQRCTAIKRVLVEKSIKDKLLKKMIEETKQQFSKIGDPRNPETQLGPVISDSQADYLQGLLKDALKKGAQIVCGGKRFMAVPERIRLRRKILELPKKLIRLKKGQGRYFMATILDKVKTNMKIAWEEQFGPILPVISVKDEREAINLNNASEYGLSASVFSKDLKKAKKIASFLDVGTVYINEKPARAPDEFPFTGTKGSGLGTQGVEYSLKAMTKIKAIRT